jgi:hypothetical protein
MKRAKLWHLFTDDIKPLPATTQVGRAMTFEEKQSLTEAAASKPEWQNVCSAMVLALNSTRPA